MSKENETELWEMQPWDTAHSFAAFRIYLAMERPRKPIKAYIEWCKHLNKAPTIDKKRNAVQVPWRFNYWARGVNLENQRPPGTVFEHAKSWYERAEAWDREADRRAEAIWAKRRAKLLEDEYRLGEQLRQRGAQMMMAPPMDYREADIAGNLDLAFKLLRRALNMEQTRVGVDWKSHLKGAGIDPEQAFRGLVDALLAGDDETPAADGAGTNDAGSGS